MMLHDKYGPVPTLRIFAFCFYLSWNKYYYNMLLNLLFYLLSNWIPNCSIGVVIWELSFLPQPKLLHVAPLLFFFLYLYKIKIIHLYLLIIFLWWNCKAPKTLWAEYNCHKRVTESLCHITLSKHLLKVVSKGHELAVKMGPGTGLMTTILLFNLLTQASAT